MLTEPQTLARVPKALLAGKSLTERVDTLNAIARPFVDLLEDGATWLDWGFDGAEMRLLRRRISDTPTFAHDQPERT